MTDIATGRQPRPSDLDKLPTAFSVAGEEQEKAADQETLILLQRFSRNPGVEKARAEFVRAQDVERLGADTYLSARRIITWSVGPRYLVKDLFTSVSDRHPDWREIEYSIQGDVRRFDVVPTRAQIAPDLALVVVAA